MCCDEGMGLLCRIRGSDYELRCLLCFTSMLQDDTHPVLVDGFQRAEHSFTGFTPSSVGDINDIVE